MTDVLTATRRLGEPVTEDGIRWLNFFNGRVLSAEDLRVDHDAITQARRQLGRALGSGVAIGFEVIEDLLVSTPGSPVLTVAPGLAVNEDGQALELRRPVRIGLIRVDQPLSGDGSAFARCDIVLPGTAGLGAYVLSVGPASADIGKAAVAGLGNQPAACNVAFSVEGVRFQLIPVPLEDGDVDEPDLLRNRIAYRMFGDGASSVTALVRNPFAVSATSTLLDDLRAACLHGTDVPLAVLHWQPVAGLRFVDRWAVRRRPARRASWGSELFAADAVMAEGEARFFQFVDHIADVRRTTPTMASLTARSRFRHLPAVGLIPLSTTGSRGVQLAQFFDQLTATAEVFLEGAALPDLIRQSFVCPPIDLESEEAIRVYLVRENQHLPTPPYAAFANGHLPYLGDAKFDLGYWNLANFAQPY